MLQLSLPTLACSFVLSFPSFVFLLSFYPIFLLLSYLKEAAFVSMLHFSMPAFAFSFFLSFFLFFSFLSLFLSHTHTYILSLGIAGSWFVLTHGLSRVFLLKPP